MIDILKIKTSPKATHPKALKKYTVFSIVYSSFSIIYLERIFKMKTHEKIRRRMIYKRILKIFLLMLANGQVRQNLII